MELARRSLGMPVAILAGGLATRLRPLTEKVPKVLLEVAGKPFLEHQLAWLREQGVRDVVLCVGHLGETIRERFGDGHGVGVRLRYSFDGPVLLGTGGAIRSALRMLGDAFVVLYGDSYLNIDLADVTAAFHRSGRQMLMTVFENDNRWDASNIEYADRVVKAYNKRLRTDRMRYIDYGLGVYSAAAFAAYPENSVFDLADLIQELIARAEVAGYEASERFYEIGSTAGLTELGRLLSPRFDSTGSGAQL